MWQFGHDAGTCVHGIGACWECYPVSSGGSVEERDLQTLIPFRTDSAQSSHPPCPHLSPEARQVITNLTAQLSTLLPTGPHIEQGYPLAVSMAAPFDCICIL